MGIFELAGKQISSLIMWIVGAFLIILWIIFVRKDPFIAWAILILGVLIFLISGFLLSDHKHREF